MRYDLLHPKALRTALLEAGVEGVPTERQVRRWVTGDTPMPAWARRAVDELLGMQKEPPPDWARALAEESADAVVRRLVPPELLGAAHRLLADLARLEPPSGEAVDAKHEEPDPVE